MEVNCPPSEPSQPPASPILTNALTELPHVPKNKPSALSRYQNQGYPRVMDILRDMEAIATQWQNQLDTIHHHIQLLYREGPIIEGWLESTPLFPSSNGASPLSYRLCGLDEKGQVWSRPCPPAEVAPISLAIHRYHQLRQYLNEKHILEAHLFQLAQSLGYLQTQIKRG